MSKETTTVFAGLVRLLENSAKEVTDLKREISSIESQRNYDVRSLHDQLTYSKEALADEMKEHDACKKLLTEVQAELDAIKTNKDEVVEMLKHQIETSSIALGEARLRITELEERNGIGSVLVIQPGIINSVDGLPYPYKVDSDGNVMHQSFWGGNPTKLIGFAKRGEEKIEVRFKDVFKRNVNIIEGLNPVFMDKDEDVYTGTNEAGYTYAMKRG